MAFERVRHVGHHNMFTDGRSAAYDAGIDWPTYQNILVNYDVYDKRWPEVRQALIA